MQNYKQISLSLIHKAQSTELLVNKSRLPQNDARARVNQKKAQLNLNLLACQLQFECDFCNILGEHEVSTKDYYDIHVSFIPQLANNYKLSKNITIKFEFYLDSDTKLPPIYVDIEADLLQGYTLTVVHDDYETTGNFITRLPVFISTIRYFLDKESNLPIF